MKSRAAVLVTLLAVGVTAVATPVSAHHSSGRGGQALRIAAITWDVDAQRFDVTHRMSRESARRAVAAGWVVRTTVVVDDVLFAGPVETPVRPEDTDTRGSLVTVSAAIPWDRDGGRARGPWFATVESAFVNRGGGTVGEPVELVAAVTEDETVIGQLSTEPDGQEGHAPPSASDSIKAGPGCSIQCITSGVAYAVGVGAHLRVTTDSPARITIGITGVGQFSSASDQVKSWGKTFPDLDPNTTYSGYAYAEDDHGVSSASGPFTTLRRFARVEFGGFELDSYPGANNEGFTFLFNSAGVWASDLEEFHHSAELPVTLPGVRTIEIADAPNILDVRVRVVAYDDDEAPCESVSYEALATSGDQGCIAWGTGQNGVGLFLDVYPDDATEWTGHQLADAAVAYGYPVNFVAPFDVDVWYD